MSEEEKVEQSEIIYWDTYRSWVDKLDDRVNSVRLFNGHPRGVHESVCNFPGAGFFPEYLGAKAILGIGIDTRASTQLLKNLFDCHTYSEICLGDKTILQINPRSDSVLHSVCEVDGVVNITQTESTDRLYRLPSPIKIPPRQPFSAFLKFDHEVEQAVRRIETKVGPGGGWVSICIQIAVIRERSIR